jgi:hypothetical protein
VASAFLLPDRELTQIDVDRATSARDVAREISQFAHSRLLSRSLVAYRLWRADKITEPTYRAIDFVSRALSDGSITPTKASKVLGVKPRSVAPLLRSGAMSRYTSSTQTSLLRPITCTMASRQFLNIGSGSRTVRRAI